MTKKPPSHTAPLCAATTDKGKPCKMRATKGEYCRRHAPKPRGITNAGRKTKLADQQLRDRLLKMLAGGVDLIGACAEVNVDPNSFYRWIEKGEDAETLQTEGYELTETEELYREFREQATRARRRFVNRVEIALADKIPDADVRELIDILQRVNRERWGRQDVVSVNHSGTVSLDVIQRYGETIAELLRGVLTDLCLTEEQEALAPAIVRTWMGRLSAGEPA